MTDPFCYETIEGMREAVSAERAKGKRIGFVPTMGALHAGHGSLIEAARRECDYVVVSIFVNPTQFGPNEDYNRYPRTFEADRDLCARWGVDAIFHPPAGIVYPGGFRTYVEVTEWQDLLCGASRPGHFRGVCTIVLKLFHIVHPDVAYFGQKDAQQALIVQRMVRDLDLPVTVRIMPTVREDDGLALSSRNRYLTPDRRRVAPGLYQSLEFGMRMILDGERDVLTVEQAIAGKLAAIPGIVIDYVNVVSSETLKRPARLAGPTLIAAAVYLGSTRLIDNVQIDVPVA